MTKDITPLWRKSHFVPGQKPKKVENAFELYAYAVEYFEYVDECNEIISEENKESSGIVSGGPTSSKEKKKKFAKKPYQVRGFCAYMGVNFNYFSKLKGRLLEKIDRPKTTPENKAIYNEILDCYDWVMDVINSQIFDGGMIGKFNAGLAARYLGMEEKQLIDLANSDGSLKPQVLVRDEKTANMLNNVIGKLANNNKTNVDE